MAVDPLEGAEEGQCFFNARNAKEKFGWEICFGWLIWEHRDFWLEAERHAIVHCGSGIYRDVTPQPDGEDRILFLRDANWFFDYENPKPSFRKRMILSDRSSVRELVRANDALDKFTWRHSKFVGQNVGVFLEGQKDKKALERLETAKKKAIQRLRRDL